jgi:hypothetical protein
MPVAKGSPGLRSVGGTNPRWTRYRAGPPAGLSREIYRSPWCSLSPNGLTRRGEIFFGISARCSAGQHRTGSRGHCSSCGSRVNLSYQRACLSNSMTRSGGRFSHLRPCPKHSPPIFKESLARFPDSDCDIWECGPPLRRREHVAAVSRTAGDRRRNDAVRVRGLDTGASGALAEPRERTDHPPNAMQDEKRRSNAGVHDERQDADRPPNGVHSQEREAIDGVYDTPGYNQSCNEINQCQHGTIPGITHSVPCFFED